MVKEDLTLYIKTHFLKKKKKDWKPRLLIVVDSGRWACFIVL